jgi:hypothetical protein
LAARQHGQRRPSPNVLGWRLKTLEILLPTLIALGAASGAAAQEQAVLLPRLAPPPPLPPGVTEAFPAVAYWGGRLEVVRGCVRYVVTDSRAYTVLWRHSTEFGLDRSGYFLRAPRSKTIYRMGQPMAVGGGAPTDEQAVARAYPEIARRCGPPYMMGWLDAGD